MNSSEFFKQFRRIRKQFNWYINPTGVIRGNPVKQYAFKPVHAASYCPITAVATAYKSGKSCYTVAAIKRLRLNVEFARAVIYAADNTMPDDAGGVVPKAIRARLIKLAGLSKSPCNQE